MATYTSYLNLKKPEGGERYALADFNANWDKIDAAVGPHNFGTVSSLSALESALDTFGSSLGIRQSRSVWVQFSATSSPFANTGYAGTFYKVFDDRYRVVFYMNANNYVIEGAKTANGWNWGSYAHDSQIDEMDDRLTSKNLSLGSFTTTITNAWENTGLTITVPNNHCFIGNLQQGYNAGRPLGIAVHDSSSLGIAGIPLKSAYDSNGLYSGFFMLTPGTWYVFSKRAGTGTNNYSFRYFDLNL